MNWENVTADDLIIHPHMARIITSMGILRKDGIPKRCANSYIIFLSFMRSEGFSKNEVRLKWYGLSSKKKHEWAEASKRLKTMHEMFYPGYKYQPKRRPKSTGSKKSSRSHSTSEAADAETLQTMDGSGHVATMNVETTPVQAPSTAVRPFRSQGIRMVQDEPVQRISGAARAGPATRRSSLRLQNLQNQSQRQFDVGWVMPMQYVDPQVKPKQYATMQHSDAFPTVQYTDAMPMPRSDFSDWTPLVSSRYAL